MSMRQYFDDLMLRLGYMPLAEHTEILASKHKEDASMRATLRANYDHQAKQAETNLMMYSGALVKAGSIAKQIRATVGNAKFLSNENKEKLLAYATELERR